MSKQPYIPLYLGDWTQDTDGLSIEAEGAWLRIIFKCWRNEGSFTATPEILARICKVDTAKFASILLEWKMNNICDILESEPGVLTLSSRRIKMDLAKSAAKALSGSKGGSKTQAKLKQKKKSAKANSDIDNDIDIDNVVSINKGGVGENILSDESLLAIFDQNTMDSYRMAFRTVDVEQELKSFILKIRGAPEDYQHRNTSGIRNAFHYQLRTAKSKPNHGPTTNKSTEHLNSLVAGYKRRHGGPAEGQ